MVEAVAARTRASSVEKVFSGLRARFEATTKAATPSGTDGPGKRRHRRGHVRERPKKRGRPRETLAVMPFRAAHEPAPRAWLSEWLERIHAGHEWIELVRGERLRSDE
jgi:hypothetical protein